MGYSKTAVIENRAFSTGGRKTNALKWFEKSGQPSDRASQARITGMATVFIFAGSGAWVRRHSFG